jgi:TorA maturation chaperone TorD
VNDDSDVGVDAKTGAELAGAAAASHRELVDAGSEGLAADVRARLAATAASRAHVYGILVTAFSEPDDDVCTALADGSLVADLSDAVAWLGVDADVYTRGVAMLRDVTVAGCTLTDLKVEFARLFTGPGLPAVGRFASQYLDEPGPGGVGRLGGEATEAAVATYQAEGLAPRSTLREPADDIATELEFLAWLCSREHQEWASGSTDEARRLRRVADDFVRHHCALWWPAFVAACQAQAKIATYRAFAEVVAAHLTIELGARRGRPSTQAGD